MDWQKPRADLDGDSARVYVFALCAKGESAENITWLVNWKCGTQTTVSAVRALIRRNEEE